MEKDIGKIKKNDTTDILVRIDDFGGKVGITIREFVTGEKYTGFTKAGTRIPVEQFPQFREFINSIKVDDLLSDMSSAEKEEKPATSSKTKPAKEKQEKTEEIEEEFL